jgi:catechol 2,3-dioxygenase-like lactoylglutathione lyase family enzyme
MGDEQVADPARAAATLFHIHFFVSDVRLEEAFYVDHLGFSVKARFGYLGRVHTGFPPEVTWEEFAARGLRLRLVELVCGAANLVLMPGREPSAVLDHIGFLLAPVPFRRCLLAAEAQGLRPERNAVRTFIPVPGGPRLEVQEAIPENRYLYDEAAYQRAHLTHVTLGAPDAEQVAQLATRFTTLLPLQAEPLAGGQRLRPRATDAGEVRAELRVTQAPIRLVEVGLALAPDSFAETAARLSPHRDPPDPSGGNAHDAAVLTDPFGVRLRLTADAALVSPPGR